MAISNIEKYKNEMKRLKKQAKAELKTMPWQKPHDPAYAKFLSDVAAVVPSDQAISDNPLYGLWHFSKGFQTLWEKKLIRKDRSHQELALFVRFLCRGLDEDQGLMILTAWWKRHGYEYGEAKLQYLEKQTIPAAKKKASKSISEQREKKKRERQERERKKTKFRILQVLFVAPAGPTEIATKIDETVGAVKMQLSRMKEVKKTKGGVYGLGTISQDLRDQLKSTVTMPELSEFDDLLYRLWKKGEPWVTPGDFIEIRRNKDMYPGLIANMRKEYPFEFLAVNKDRSDDIL